ncbi:hypothetical protein [Streptomyces violaceus]|uniref:Uncharacterized protein n=1 Tax=Streptomyces violaceus TaxID=1936 RepID=A0ABZ1NLX8_STRVL
MSVRPIAQLDVPTADLVASLAATTLHAAAERTHSPSDRIAYAFDEWLVTHPKTPVSTDADYAGWAEHIAALQAANPRQTARKEAS